MKLNQMIFNAFNRPLNDLNSNHYCLREPATRHHLRPIHLVKFVYFQTFDSLFQNYLKRQKDFRFQGQFKNESLISIDGKPIHQLIEMYLIEFYTSFHSPSIIAEIKIFLVLSPKKSSKNSSDVSGKKWQRKQIANCSCQLKKEESTG